MRNTKMKNIKMFCAMTIILITVIALICISCSGIITAQADVTESPIGFEQKIYTEININDDFDDNCVVVVMDKFSSGINKSHSAKFSKFPFVKAISDLTTLTGDIKNKLYLNKENFRQIIKIDLKESSKQKVLEAITELQKIDGVLWAGVNEYAKPCDLPDELPLAMSGSRYLAQWGIRLKDTGIDALGAWEYTTGSKAIKVGIIDSGISDHEDLRDNVMAGWNFIDDNDNTNDTYGHGTAIAGIIGATGTNEKGVVGVNWNIKMAPLKTDFIYEYTDDNGNPKKEVRFSGNAITNAITWAIDNNIDIINASYSSQQESIQNKTAMSNFNGLFVCSASNDSTNNDTTKYYPSDYSQGQEFSDRVISVGAIDLLGDISDFSNFGANTVSLFAPGSDIITTTITEIDTSGYKYVRGTSFAAPYVVGVAALLYAQYYNNAHHYDDATVAAKVKNIILTNVTKDDRYNGKCVSGGRLNAAEALKNCQYIQSVMSDYCYNDGWYNWKAKVDIEISEHGAYDFNEMDELVITKPTNLSFAFASTYAFNAVKRINFDIQFSLKNSSGNLVHLYDNVVGLRFYGDIGIVSNPRFGNFIIPVDATNLPDDKYTLTWICNSVRNDKTYRSTKSFSFIINKTSAHSLTKSNFEISTHENKNDIENVQDHKSLITYTMLANNHSLVQQTMKIDEEAYLADIEKYGLFTYEEFTEICPVPETTFEAFGGQYLKVAIGKGLTTIEEIQDLIARYSKFWE